MAIEAERSPMGPDGRYEHVTHLVFGVTVPVLFCALLVEARAVHFVSLLRDRAYADVRGILEILQLVLSIVFISMMVFLFFTRKKAVGPGASWTGRVVAISGGVVAPSLMMFAGEAVHLSGGMLFSSVLALLLGDALSIWALSSLGRCFGVFPAARGLVRHGPYKLVRHPLYMAEGLAMFGLLLARPSVLTLAIYTVSMALQAWRAVNEEQVLRQVFPEYASYQESTGRFFPRLRRPATRIHSIERRSLI